MRAGMVAVEELLLYFLIVPALAYAGAAAWLRWTMRRIAEHQLGFLRGRETNMRFLVFAAYLSTSIVFGVVIFVQLMRAQESAESDVVIRWLGITYGAASVLTIASQAWIVVRRKATAYREYFARVLVLTVLPETTVLFTLVVAFLLAGVLRHPLTGGDADALVRACQLMLIGSLGAPLAAFFANRPLSLESEPMKLAGFSKAVSFAVFGSAVSALCMALAFLQILTV